MPDNTNDIFDPIAFLDELIEKMGLQHQPRQELETLKEGMAEALHREIFQAAADAMEPEVVDMILERYPDEEDTWFLITEMVKTSPQAQIAMMQAVNEFETNTLETLNHLKNAD